MTDSDSEEEYPHVSVYEDEPEPPRTRGSSRPTRRCRSVDPSAATPKGLFYPNWKTKGVLQDESRPAPRSGLRDTSLDDLFDQNVKTKVNEVLGAIGLVYVGTGGAGTFDGAGEWDQSDAATFWLLEHNGKLVGVTALRPFRMKGLSLADTHIFINPVPEDNLLSERTSFHRQDTINRTSYIEVKLREDLVLIREQYIEELFNTRDAAKVTENIDPDYNMHYSITVDVAFLDLEPHKASFANWPRCKLASSLPVVDNFDLSIGYNYGGRWKQDELKAEFAATMHPPAASLLYYADCRSVSLGRVKAVGTGIITDVSTTEEMSSGSPKFILEGGELRVFGISVGSYYDAAEKVAPNWKLKKSTDLHKTDVRFPEPGYTAGDVYRNRNIIVGIHHSCVKAMLDKI